MGVIMKEMWRRSKWKRLRKWKRECLKEKKMKRKSWKAEKMRSWRNNEKGMKKKIKKE
jgi:hypothetical protein